MPRLREFVPDSVLHSLIQQTRREDVGPHGLDVTSVALVPEGERATAQFRARKAGRLCGAALLPAIAGAYSQRLELDVKMQDGDALAAGDVIATVSGRLRVVLAFERVALNFMTHLSGIASLTAQYVEAIAGTKAKIYDTRKTIPGLRGLAKYAVVCGGGMNHRIGLYDAMLVKDNHIAHVPQDKLTATLKEAIANARKINPQLTFAEVEVDTLEQLEAVLPAGPDVVLLDNMGPDVLRQAVAMRDAQAANVELEASGGINMDTLRAVAETGVDRIAIGALTHSAPSLDIGLDIAHV